jgi:hypothetical protein
MKNFRISEFVIWTDSNTTPSSAYTRTVSSSDKNYRLSLFFCLKKLNLLLQDFQTRKSPPLIYLNSEM